MAIPDAQLVNPFSRVSKWFGKGTYDPSAGNASPDGWLGYNTVAATWGAYTRRFIGGFQGAHFNSGHTLERITRVDETLGISVSVVHNYKSFWSEPDSTWAGTLGFSFNFLKKGVAVSHSVGTGFISSPRILMQTLILHASSTEESGTASVSILVNDPLTDAQFMYWDVSWVWNPVLLQYEISAADPVPWTYTPPLVGGISVQLQGGLAPIGRQAPIGAPPAAQGFNRVTQASITFYAEALQQTQSPTSFPACGSSIQTWVVLSEEFVHDENGMSVVSIYQNSGTITQTYTNNGSVCVPAAPPSTAAMDAAKNAGRQALADVWARDVWGNAFNSMSIPQMDDFLSVAVTPYVVVMASVDGSTVYGRCSQQYSPSTSSFSNSSFSWGPADGSVHVTAMFSISDSQYGQDYDGNGLTNYSVNAVVRSGGLFYTLISDAADPQTPAPPPSVDWFRLDSLVFWTSGLSGSYTTFGAVYDAFRVYKYDAGVITREDEVWAGMNNNLPTATPPSILIANVTPSNMPAGGLSTDPLLPPFTNIGRNR